ncbi:MAG: GAF domain-containing protein [Bacteroidales bacterium]|nr:GAF domain-containing protein [Bacteroidales bacterium]
MAENKSRIGIGFKLLFVIFSISLIIIITNILVYNSFVNEFRTQSKSFALYQPSIQQLDQLNEINITSVSLTKNWVFIDKDTGTIQKKELINIHNNIYTQFKQNNNQFVQLWDIDLQNQYYDLQNSMDSLMTKEAVIMDQLSFFEDYQNPTLMFGIFPQITENGSIISNSKRVSKKIDDLKNIFITKVQENTLKAKKQFIHIKLLITWFTTLIVVLLIILAVFIIRNILFITNILNEVIKKTREGYLPIVKKVKRNDEIGELSSNLEGLILHLRKLSDFANEIGQNTFNTQFKPASEGDVLGNALLRMRDNLVKAQTEADTRQVENTQRNWASQGIAVFNEVIRDHNNDLEKLTFAVIEKLVNYTESNIGGLFIVNEDNERDKYLELKAFYAYDRHKYLEKNVKFGETLVGQCYVEKDTIYVTEVPDDYMFITSGLGTDKPKSILIVPLQFNEITYGVIELASFKNFENYKIDFVEKISETIASAISTAKINERTTKLLEESNEKSKRLEQQEIQARENIAKVQKEIGEIEKSYKELTEEKERILKELALKDDHFNKERIETKTKIETEIEKRNALLNAINNLTPYYEMSLNGDILYANKNYVGLFNMQENDILGNKHIKLISRDFINSGQYKQIWDSLKNKQKVDTSVQYMIDGKSRFLNEVFIPVADEKGNIKISVFGKF